MATLVTGAGVDRSIVLDCRVTDSKVTATHTVLFGEVKAVHFGPIDASLIYLDRGYRSL
jgi:cob(II)yrinic acid a,c-diamide reductase